MKAFIDEYPGVRGFEPIRKGLPIAPSAYRLGAARQADPDRRSVIARRDEHLREQNHGRHPGAPCPLDRVNRQFTADRLNVLEAV